jgi:hypothetical protein
VESTIAEPGSADSLASIMNPRKPTEVCITIDTEFSIGGNFANPDLSPIAEPIVLGMSGGREHGLGFLLDSFAEFGARATFFVEALQTAYFGAEPMGSIARRIADAGHDVQLHLHPCWLHYEENRFAGAKKAPDDSCAGRTDAELDHFFEYGISAFSRWGLPRPVAVRTGNFNVDTGFFRAAARAGLQLSSSIAVSVHRPPEQELMLIGGRHYIGRVLELPVFCYTYRVGRHDRLRALCITASSLAELVSVLQQAHDRQISPVIILTHPQEFIKKTDFRYTILRQNRVNQTRLTGLLQFLSQNQDKFITVPITAIKNDGPGDAGPAGPAVSVPFGNAIARMLENGLNDRIWWY